MKLPRDISGPELARLLKKLGYQITRQTGSHLRLTTDDHSQHFVRHPWRRGRAFRTQSRRIDSTAFRRMSKPWPTVRLGEVLKHSEENIEPVPDAEFRENRHLTFDPLPDRGGEESRRPRPRSQRRIQSR